MKANLDLDEAQMKVAAEEEKKRRREPNAWTCTDVRRCHGSRPHLWHRRSGGCWYHSVRVDQVEVVGWQRADVDSLGATSCFVTEYVTYRKRLASY